MHVNNGILAKNTYGILRKRLKSSNGLKIEVEDFGFPPTKDQNPKGGEIIYYF